MRWWMIAAVLAGCGNEPPCKPGACDTDTDTDTDTDADADADVGSDWPDDVRWPTCGGAFSPGDVAGKGYILDRGSVRMVVPEGTGELLLSAFDDDLLVGVVEASAASVDARFGIGLGGEQDLCAPTPDMALAADGSCVAFGPSDMVVNVSGIAVDLLDVVMWGAVEPGGGEIADVVLGGYLDTSALWPLVTEVPDPYALCELADGLGFDCVACPGGGEVTCLQLIADGARFVEGDPVVAVADPPTAPECEGQAGCSGGCSASGGVAGGLWGLALGALALRRRQR